MGGLRFAAVLLLAASCGALLLAASEPAPPPRSPAVYVVGDELGWAVPSARAFEALNEWAASHRFLVGDVLDFKYGSDDSVLLVRQADYEQCSAASPLSRFAAAGGGGGTKFTLGRPGLFYFISGARVRCEMGQRMAVRVVDGARPSRASGAPTPAPAPAPVTQPSDTPPSGHRRLSLAHKQWAAAAIGLGSGVLSVYFVVWLCVCCGNGN